MNDLLFGTPKNQKWIEDIRKGDTIMVFKDEDDQQGNPVQVEKIRVRRYGCYTDYIINDQYTFWGGSLMMLGNGAQS